MHFRALEADTDWSSQGWSLAVQLSVLGVSSASTVSGSKFSSVQSLSCVWLFVTPWTPGLPVHQQLLEFTQTHVHWVSDAIRPSHPLSSPSPAFSLSRHQGLFKWVSSSHQVAKVLGSGCKANAKHYFFFLASCVCKRENPLWICLG